MESKRLTTEKGVYLLAFLAALGLRLYQLGALPLSDLEASAALQALGTAQGQHPLVTIQPLYTALTASLFFLLGSGNVLARLIPALAGSLMVWTPFFFRRWLGKVPALVLAFALALDPTFLAASRQVNTPILAVVFGVLAVGFWVDGRKVWSGACAGLALLGGTGLWPGVLAAGLAVLWTRLINRQEGEPVVAVNGKSEGLRDGLMALVGAFFLAGTLFFMMPDGIGAAAGGFTAYIKGWVTPSSYGIVFLLITLLSYEFLPILLGLWGSGIGWWNQNDVDRFLSRWLLISLVLVLIYPGRTPLDLMWVLLPLWGLAAIQLERLLQMAWGEDPLVYWGLTILVTVLIVFAVNNLRGYLNPSPTGVDLRVYAWSILAALVLILGVSFLVGWGWTPRAGIYGFLSGVIICLVFGFFSAGWNAGGLGEHAWAEQLRNGPSPLDADIILKTVADASEWGTGDRQLADVSVVGEESPALHWQLRTYHKTTYVQTLSADATPSVAITGDTITLEQTGTTYRGQDFYLWQEPDWASMQYLDWARWALFRSAPVKQQRMIVWVKNDIFPGYQAEDQAVLTPAE